MKISATFSLTIAVQALGFIWALESILGKIIIERGHNLYLFPITLNVATLIFALALNVKSRSRASNPALSLSDIAWLMALGVTLIFIPYLLIYSALRYIPPLELALYSSLTPGFSVIIGSLILRSPPSTTTLAGIALGCLGLIILIYFSNIKTPTTDIGSWHVFMLGVPLSFAASTYVFRKISTLNINYTQVLWSSNALSLTLFLVLMTLDDEFSFQPVSATDVLAFGIGTGCNIAAIILTMKLAKAASPVHLSTSNYALVTFSLLLSGLVLNITPTIPALSALVFVMLGSYLTGADNDRVRHYKWK